MPDPLSLVAATVLAQAPIAQPPRDRHQQIASVQTEKNRLDTLLRQLRRPTPQPEASPKREFAPQPATPPTPTLRPQSGSELYVQRLAALRTGHLYTRLPQDSFAAAWQGATQQPTYEQWRQLLAQEANVVARKNDDRPVGIIVGDSLSLWFPSDRLPLNTSEHIWLNQAISGETTRQILQRLGDFATTRPRVIYVMAGVNDLKNGVSDADILANLTEIVTRLQRQHPQAKIVLQSILPTRRFGLPRDRITTLNQQLAAIAHQKQVYYLDVYQPMADPDGGLRADLTTDGLHLNQKGYATWQTALQQSELKIARQ